MKCLRLVVVKSIPFEKCTCLLKLHYFCIWHICIHLENKFFLQEQFSPTYYVPGQKKFVVIVGGYDAVSYKDLKHGVFQKRNLRSKIASLIYNYATEIWVVHKSLIYGCKQSKDFLNIDDLEKCKERFS